MKKILKASLFLLLFAVLSTTAFGLTITDGPHIGTDVGYIDIFLDSGVQLGNPTDETNWANTILGSDMATFHVKDEPVTYYATEESGVFAFYMPSPASEYFLIKNATYVALFENLDELAWGVFDTDLLPEGMNLPSEGFQISHVTRFNAAPVPEPSTLLLLGSGIIGFAVYRRKKK